MNEYNDSIPYWNENESYQLTAKQTVGAIQNVSNNIKAYALQMKETVKILRQTGAIPEIALAIKETTYAVRDTVKELNETAQDLKKNGLIKDTANAVETTVKNAEESIATVKEITNDAQKASPYTSKVVKDGIDVFTKETVQMTGKLMEGIKTKVGAQ